jgi:nicotinamide-nucleotide amidase
MNYVAEILAVGTELLLGDIANTDAQVISRALSQLGITVYYHTVVGDNPQRLKEAVEVAKKRANIIITTGGLGPTYDDLTKQTLAEAFGKPLLMHEPSAQKIRDYFMHNDKRKVPENSMQQAMMPEGCTVFDNSCGTAPGCAFVADGIHVLMLPGPPRECASMFEHCAVPYLKTLSDATIFSRTIHVFGMGEPAVENKLKGMMQQMENPTVAPYAKEGEVMLRVTAKASTKEEAERMVQPVMEQVAKTLGDVVYGFDVPSLEAVVFEKMKEKGLTLAAAESCTGGLLAKRFTDLPGASAVFLGAVVSYSADVKQNVLGVPKEVIAEKGTVSEETARYMAEGARRVLGADLAISVTGVAGPEPDEKNNPVGLVYAGLATKDGTYVRKVHVGRDRGWVRIMATLHGLDMARRYLTGKEIEKTAEMR